MKSEPERGAGRRSLWRIGVIAAVLLGCVVVSVPGVAQPPAPNARAGDRYTPVIERVMSKPRWFRGSDHRIHLAYELKLTNGFNAPVTVTSVEVLEARRNRTIASLSDSDLEAAMSLLASPDAPTTTLPGSAVGVVWFDIELAHKRRLPDSIRHEVTVAVPPDLPVPPTITDRGGFAEVDQRPPVSLGPPLRGPGWVAVGSCCDGPHRRSVQPVNGRLFLAQRYAIDWNGVDSDGRFVVGDPDLNSSWTFYGKPVLSVADARVVAAVDRFPDQTPNHPNPVTIEEADGNHVILALGRHRFAFYAHLQPGSVTVRRGQRVRRGQQIGRLGNSGSSTGPHLHFQVMNRPSALAANGLPMVFERFRFDGRIPPLDDALSESISAGEPVPIDPLGAGRRHRELPLGRDVIDFPGRR